MAATMMACKEGMAQEQRFLQALEETFRFRIQDDTLSLLNADGQVLLKFAAVYLP